jgi:hypothetical protein
MTSKQITDRARSARAVEAAATTHLALLSARVQNDLAAALAEGEAAPDVAFLIQLYLRLMLRALDRLEGAERAHSAELADDAPARDERDDAADACAAVIQDLRSLITNLYPPEVAAKLHLGTATPPLPDALSQQADTIAQAARTLDLGAPRLPGVQLDLAPTFASLDTARARLSAALRNVAAERREAEQTQRAKDAAVADFDAAFTAAAGLLSLLLRLHGEPELARRVRPSRRRPGRRAVDAGEEPGVSEEG